MTVLKPGDVYSTPRTFLSVYSGDFYEPLKMWSDAIAKEGLTKPENNDGELRCRLVRMGLRVCGYAEADAGYSSQIKGVGNPLGHTG